MLIIHEKNNCILESEYTSLLANPYILKLFYLINYLFLKNLLKKNELPVTFEICKFFKKAIDNPNFHDKVSCLSISRAFFKNYKKHTYIVNEKHHFGGFQNHDYIDTIHEIFVREVFKFTNTLYNYLVEDFCKKVNKNCNFDHFNDKNYDDGSDVSIDIYKNKYGKPFNSMIIFAAGFHKYTYRNINGTWINYDSFDVKEPTPVNEKNVVRLFLNNYLRIPNYNGMYQKKYLWLTFR